jgi:ribosomal protein L17
MQKPGTSSWRWCELRRAADLGICRGPSSVVTREDVHEPTKKRRPIRESVEDLVRESRVKTFTNRRGSKVKVVVPKSPGFECELVADL